MVINVASCDLPPVNFSLFKEADALEHSPFVFLQHQRPDGHNLFVIFSLKPIAMGMSVKKTHHTMELCVQLIDFTLHCAG